MTQSETAQTEQGTAPAGQLGWGKFLIQIITVVVGFIAPSIIPILIFGESSVGAALSALFSMAGGLSVAWLWLRKEGLTREVFDLSHPGSWPRTLLYSVGAFLVIIAIFNIGAPMIELMGLAAPAVTTVLDWVTESHFTFALWIIVVAWGSAAFGEELLWRGFLMDRLTRLKGIGTSTVAVLIIHAIIFGLPHAYQGWGGVIITGTVGLFLGWLRLQQKGNLWVCIIAHGLVDSIMMSLAYASKLGWITV